MSTSCSVREAGDFTEGNLQVSIYFPTFSPANRSDLFVNGTNLKILPIFLSDLHIGQLLKLISRKNIECHTIAI